MIEDQQMERTIESDTRFAQFYPANNRRKATEVGEANENLGPDLKRPSLDCQATPKYGRVAFDPRASRAEVR